MSMRKANFHSAENGQHELCGRFANVLHIILIIYINSAAKDGSFQPGAARLRTAFEAALKNVLFPRISVPSRDVRRKFSKRRL